MSLITTSKTFSASHPIWLCDIWGVVHNGLAPFQSAVEALIRHREAGGLVVLISNSPRPKPQLVEQLDLLHVGPEAYDGIVSSGDVTRAHVEERLGQGVFHLGPERDKGIFKGFDCTFAEVTNADYIVCSGLFDDTTETPEDYKGLLQECADRNLVMVCANPDLKVQRGEDLIYCAGSLAQKYETYGGEVIYAGKPYSPIYDLAVQIASEHMEANIAKDLILAIGDGVHTDVAGAANYGCDFLFIAGGLHMAEAGQKEEMSECQAKHIAKDLLDKNPALSLVGVASYLA